MPGYYREAIGGTTATDVESSPAARTRWAKAIGEWKCVRSGLKRITAPTLFRYTHCRYRAGESA
jgi:hypothetical protein